MPFACSSCSTEYRLVHGFSCYGGCGKMFCWNCRKGNLEHGMICKDCESKLPGFLSPKDRGDVSMCLWPEGKEILARLSKRCILIHWAQDYEDCDQYFLEAYDSEEEMGKRIEQILSTRNKLPERDIPRRGIVGVWIDGRRQNWN